MQRFQRRSESLWSGVRRLAILLGGGIVVLGIGIALFSPVFHVQRIRVARSDPRIDVEQIQRALAPLFNRHLFFLPPEEVQRLLVAQVPDLAGAEATKLYPSTLGVHLTLDPIIARLVIEDPDRARVASGSGSAAAMPSAKTLGDFLTERGMYVAYAPSQVASMTGMLTVHVVDWGVRPVPGKPLVEPEILSAMRAVEGAIVQDFQQPVKSRTVFVRAREFHMEIPRHTLWFDLRSSQEEQLARYRLFLQSGSAQEAKQYVDLRLKEKIVYR